MYPWIQESPLSKSFKDVVEYKGLFVTKYGLIFKKNGRYCKPYYYRKGGKIVNTYIRWKDDNGYHKYSYRRFVYAAFNQDTFDINDKSLVVRSKTSQFNTELSNLYVMTREDMIKEMNETSRKIPLSEKEVIQDVWNKTKDVLTLKQVADHLGVTEKYLRRYLDT